MSMGGCIHFLKIVAVFYATITSTRTVFANNKDNSIFIKKVLNYALFDFIIPRWRTLITHSIEGMIHLLGGALCIKCKCISNCQTHIGWF